MYGAGVGFPFWHENLAAAMAVSQNGEKQNVCMYGVALGNGQKPRKKDRPKSILPMVD